MQFLRESQKKVVNIGGSEHPDHSIKTIPGFPSTRWLSLFAYFDKILSFSFSHFFMFVYSI